MNFSDERAILEHIALHVAADDVQVSLHAHAEMVEEDFELDDVFSALKSAQLLENYPEHKRGSCCLILGRSRTGRSAHIVCTTSLLESAEFSPIPSSRAWRFSFSSLTA